jgi:hypothetical protein
MISVLAGLVFWTGCAGPTSKPTKYARLDPAPIKTPPPGKCLVCIHRPKARQAQWVKTGLWDGGTLIGNIGSGNSIAYVCDPGQHYFLSRSFEQNGAVEGTLQAEQIYDLWIDPGAYFAPTPKIKPVKPGSKQRTEVPRWMTEHRWVTRDESAAEHERQDSEAVKKLIQEFVSGRENYQLGHLAAEDHR